MFKIKIADLVIEIDNRYDFVRRMCRDYIEENEEPVFSVCVTDADMEKEREASEEEFSDGYIESVCVYRHICNKLPLYGAFLLHASVIEVDGRSYAFSAPSGTGKSTHTRLWLELFGERARIINGDKPIMRFAGDELIVYGTPWCGKEGYNINASSPLSALCFLNRGQENKIDRCDEGTAVMKLFHQILIPQDEETASALFELLDKMVCSVPIYELYCNMLPEAAQVAYDGMKKPE